MQHSRLQMLTQIWHGAMLIPIKSKQKLRREDTFKEECVNQNQNNQLKSTKIKFKHSNKTISRMNNLLLKCKRMNWKKIQILLPKRK